MYSLNYVYSYLLFSSFESIMLCVKYYQYKKLGKNKNHVSSQLFQNKVRFKVLTTSKRVKSLSQTMCFRNRQQTPEP